MAEGTIMVIEVDLKCCKCRKKIKKILCEIPQIQDQVYDEKQNTVTIKVACSCCPEKMMQKIRCKGGKSIISIKIKPPKKKDEEKPTDEKQKVEGKQKEKSDPNPKDKLPTKVAVEVLPPKIPFEVCCKECSEGRRGGPCEQLAYGRPPCGYYGRPVCDCGCNRGYYCWNRCGYYYYYEENPSPCSIM